MTRVRVAPSWLALREPSDADARATDLVAEICQAMPVGAPIVIHDLACGTGAMFRWLAPRLPGPQHWINYDADSDLLADLLARPAVSAADGSPVTTEVRCGDVTRLGEAELRHATLITSSALLDLLCADELRRLVRTCAAVASPALFTLTVTGSVHIDPWHPLDQVIAAAFNDHQRRIVNGRTLLGPDAAPAAVRMFAELGRPVATRSTPWRLDVTSRGLAVEWLWGWLAAACEQDPQLTTVAGGYAEERLRDVAAGRLRIVVEHTDLLARPARPTVDEPSGVPLRVP